MTQGTFKEQKEGKKRPWSSHGAQPKSSNGRQEKRVSRSEESVIPSVAARDEVKVKWPSNLATWKPYMTLVWAVAF